MPVIRPPQFHGFNDIEAFYATFIPHLHDHSTKSLTLDLTQYDFLPLEVLLSLAGSSKLWFQEKQTRVTWQVQLPVAQYLERIDLLTTFSDYLELSESSNIKWDRGSSTKLLEVRTISCDEEDNSKEVPALIHSISTILLGRISAKQFNATGSLLSEIAQNVIHSYSEGYVQVQVHATGQNNRVHIGIIDLGIGIPTSLIDKYPNIGSQSDYIKFSLQSGITSKNTGDGLGLHLVDTLVRKNRGVLTIRSAGAMVQFYMGRLYQWDDLTDISGTQVFITMWGTATNDNWQYLLQ